MARLLLAEDDPDQRMLRQRILERAGHTVRTADSAETALASIAEEAPDCVLMDLRLPEEADGLRLIRRISEKWPGLRVVVVSGWCEGLLRRPEASGVFAALKKPVRTEVLLKMVAKAASVVALLFLLAAGAWGADGAREFSFEVTRPGETVAALRMSAPGADWAVEGKEGSLVRLSVDGGAQHNVMVPTSRERTYRVFLGGLKPGKHTLAVSRDARMSAAGAGLVVTEVGFETVPASDPAYAGLANAPILYPRSDTVGKFTDVPVLAYCTRASERGQTVLEYTIVFTNEDGGTSTRDLMARWSRTVDVEFVYRVWVNKRGAPVKALIQTKEHAEVPFEGLREGFHPLLETITYNNMVGPAARDAAPVRYQLAPTAPDFSANSRERVLDDDPELNEIAAKEMAREGKLRKPLTFDEEKIADPRNYLVVELKGEMKYAALQVLVRGRGAAVWRGSSAGLAKNFIERSGWARVAIELPPGTRNEDIQAMGFECLSRRDLEKEKIPKNGHCQVEKLGKVFFLAPDYSPGALLPLPPVPAGGWMLNVGELLTLDLR